MIDSCAQVYWIGPIVGAVAGGALYKWVFGKRWSFGQQQEDEPPTGPMSYELTDGPAKSGSPYAVGPGSNEMRSEFDFGANK